MEGARPVPVSLEDSIDQLTFLPDRTPTGINEDSADAFKRLADYRDGAIFVGHWAGLSEWERHTIGDEIVMVIDGTTTIFFLDGETEHPATLHPGELVVVPRARGIGSKLRMQSKSSASRRNPRTTRPSDRLPIWRDLRALAPPSGIVRRGRSGRSTASTRRRARLAPPPSSVGSNGDAKPGSPPSETSGPFLAPHGVLSGRGLARHRVDCCRTRGCGTSRCYAWGCSTQNRLTWERWRLEKTPGYQNKPENDSRRSTVIRVIAGLVVLAAGIIIVIVAS